jgi:FKBP-type peptidyl-prolyl cis-trans isomerase
MKKISILIVSTLIIFATIFLVLFFTKNSKSVENDIKIKDIVLANKTDSISYALGKVWANNINKYIGITHISYAFYSGVQDYINKDSSKMGIYKSNDYLQALLDKIKSDTLWPKNNDDILLSRIPFKTKYDSFSYALGFAWCSSAYKFGIAKVSPALIIGLSKGFKGDTSLFKNFDSATNYLMSYIEELRLKKFASIKKTNEEFLKENATKEGVKTLPGGLQYKIIKSGKGISPTEQDLVECLYIGKLIDGKVFDNSYKETPFKGYVGSVVKGWSDALKLMKEGDEWIIYIPYNLAYGSGGIENLIPSYATILIDCELVKVTRNK